MSDGKYLVHFYVRIWLGKEFLQYSTADIVSTKSEVDEFWNAKLYHWVREQMTHFKKQRTGAYRAVKMDEVTVIQEALNIIQSRILSKNTLLDFATSVVKYQDLIRKLYPMEGSLQFSWVAKMNQVIQSCYDYTQEYNYLQQQSDRSVPRSAEYHGS